MKIKYWLLGLVLIILIPVFLTGCNYQTFDTNFTYTHAYVQIGEEWKLVEITAWRDYDGEQLQIKLKDGTVLLVSSFTCILCNGTLPE